MIGFSLGVLLAGNLYVFGTFDFNKNGESEILKLWFDLVNPKRAGVSTGISELKGGGRIWPPKNQLQRSTLPWWCRVEPTNTK